MAILLAACGGSQAAPPSPAVSGGSAASAAGSQSWDELVAAAKKEGTVAVSGTNGNAYREFFVNRFQEAYPGIKVEGVFASTADRQSRLMLERQAGKYTTDIWASAGGASFFDFKKSGTMVPLPPQLVLPEVTNTANWFENHLWWVDKSEPYTYAMPTGSVIPVVYVNPNMVDPKSFTSYNDLLDPKWKGKIVSTDIRNSGAGVAPSRMVRKAMGDGYMSQLFKSGVKLSADQRQLVNFITEGSYPIGVFLDPGEVTIAIKQGLPIVMVSPDQFKEGAPVGPNNGGIAMVDHAPHPNAARLYVNWYLSKAGQLAWQRQAGDNSYRIDIPKDMVNPLYVPKAGGKYVNVGDEAITAEMSQASLKKLIDDAIGV